MLSHTQIDSMESGSFVIAFDRKHTDPFPHLALSVHVARKIINHFIKKKESAVVRRQQLVRQWRSKKCTESISIAPVFCKVRHADMINDIRACHKIDSESLNLRPCTSYQGHSFQMSCRTHQGQNVLYKQQG